MGKKQAAGTSPAKAVAAHKASKPAKGGAKETEAPQEKGEAKPSALKEGGAKAPKVEKSEIDDIFSAGKEKAQKSASEKRAAEDAAVEVEPAKRSRIDGSKDDIFGQAASNARKRTEEGFVIYTEDELGMGGKGGDTDLCPFDCQCCF